MSELNHPHWEAPEPKSIKIIMPGLFDNGFPLPEGLAVVSRHNPGLASTPAFYARNSHWHNHSRAKF